MVISEAERDAWLLCMKKAIALQNYTPAFGDYLLAQLRIPAERIFAVAKKPLSHSGSPLIHRNTC